MAAISALPQQVHPNAPAGLHPKYVRQVVELAFMGLVAAWEEFLEQALVRYVAGAKAKNGYKPTPRYGLAKDISHAYELLSRDPSYDPLKHYLKVTDTKWVRTNADFFFSSHTFSALQQKADLLSHASSIRNRVAHSSEKCRADFKATALHFLQPANGKLTQGYAPGDFLLAGVQRHFGQPVVQAGHTHFEAYAKLYEELAGKIVP
ncbi:hypothetical protein QRD43_21875 [Pelomonas sp. APW6]|uniref:RiboL-PSP-HEPN domain-containing protein n=1 Tax=Roseateles subflavus TaxID=3053353 RepID=A0ABT7LQ68_9BURK|nr:hypothetical protein [Pelomonas sp. APW6]MDL5034569.1 hypothetical protein [Pelomonas sp. APW6]